MANLLLENVTKAYLTRGEPLAVLRGVSLAMRSGDSAAIMGPSGSGKSTLLNLIGTLEPPTSGRILLDGEDPAGMFEPKLASLRSRTIGFVFQDHHLLPQCSVLENVLVPTIAAGSTSRAMIDRAKALLARVGLADRMEHRPAELSGGERQRTSLARSLIHRPILLLADEPTGNLDRANAEGVVDLLLELHREESTMLLVATHSAQLAARMARRYALDQGMLVEQR
jgi:lipoprotein-releasing system ATP-binding protein